MKSSGRLDVVHPRGEMGAGSSERKFERKFDRNSAGGRPPGTQPVRASC